MVPLAVIVSDGFSNGPPKMGLPKWNDPIEAFALDGQDKSLRIGVQVWAPRRQQERLHPCRSQRLPELLRVQRISVEDQVPLCPQESLVSVEQVPRHLLYPLAARIAGQTYDLDHPTRDVYHKQHVVPHQSHHRQHLNRKEIHPGNRAQMCLNEGRPRVLPLSVWSRLDSVLGQDTLNGAPPDVVAEIVQRIAHPTRCSAS